MCGIAGILNLDGGPVDRRALERMSAAIVHRGPDGSGIWVDGQIGFGHQRLAIRDLSEAGRQPMVDPSTGIVVTYNGEIYNDAQLKQDLAQEGGTTFRTTCDTEIIAPAYASWGASAFDRLQGMFALALWDPTDETLVLVRDPVGIKPLYFSVVGGSLRFASEIKALLALDDQPFRLDPDSLHRFLAQGYPGPERSLLRGVWPLPPGSFLLARRGEYRIERYWRPQRRADIEHMGDAIAGFETLWPQVVSDHLVSDVPVGLLLSAGIDSSLVATALRGRREVSTFTAAFSERDFDETEQASTIATACGLSHRAVPIRQRQDVAARFRAIVHHYDGQCADSSGLAFHAVCEAAASGAKVVLTGDGADEFFGGYETYRATRIAAPLGRWAPRHLTALAARLLRATVDKSGERRVTAGEKAFRWMSGIAAAPDCPHPQWRRYGFADVLATLYAPAMREAVHDSDPLEDYGQAVEEAHGSLVDRCLIADQSYYLPGDLLVKSDTMSMAHSIEVRVPFLDRRIMEFAGRLSPKLLTPLRGPDKRLLRKALERQRLPSNVSSAKKRGFNVPVARLLRTDLKPLGERLLDREADSMKPYLSPDAVRRVWRDHQENRANHSYLIWALLTLATWTAGAHADAGRQRITQ